MCAGISHADVGGCMMELFMLQALQYKAQEHTILMTRCLGQLEKEEMARGKTFTCKTLLST